MSGARGDGGGRSAGPGNGRKGSATTDRKLGRPTAKSRAAAKTIVAINASRRVATAPARTMLPRRRRPPIRTTPMAAATRISRASGRSTIRAIQIADAAIAPSRRSLASRPSRTVIAREATTAATMGRTVFDQTDLRLGPDQDDDAQGEPRRGTGGSATTTTAGRRPIRSPDGDRTFDRHRGGSIRRTPGRRASPRHSSRPGDASGAGRPHRLQTH